jgi:hypothetical protein
MNGFFVLCTILLGAEMPGPAQQGMDLPAYVAAKTRAGSDPDSNVRLALWCEAHGMEAERVQHLSAALLANPAQAKARGLLGLVSYRGDWRTPDAVARQAEADKLLAQYNAEREQTPETADGHWKLASWCEARGLKAEAMAHLTAVTRLAPERSDAWKRMGCRPLHGQWLSPEQFAAEQAEADAQRKADRYWEPLLETWRKQLERGGDQAENALADLARVNDPHAVPSIRRVFCKGDPDLQLLSLKMLSGIKGPEASRTIAIVSLYARAAEVRNAALDELKERDPRDFMAELIATLRRPLTYQVSPVGALGKAGVLEIEGERYRSKRIYRVPTPLNFNPSTRGGFAFTSGVYAPLRSLFVVEAFAPGSAQNARNRTEQKLDRDVGSIERHNSQIRVANRPVVEVLEAVTGQPIGDDPDQWSTWWYDQEGYRYEPPIHPYKRTTLRYVRIPLKSCFGQGTPVLTIRGPRPIETLRIGDLVLSQNCQSGRLSYEPVVGLHHNSPMPTLRLRLGDEEILSTTYHRFWRAGRAWEMARELELGDVLRKLAGRIKVDDIQVGPVEPVFNLDVAGNCTYFVGKNAVLVHDNSLPPPMLTPFDAEPVLEVIAHDGQRGSALSP